MSITIDSTFTSFASGTNISFNHNCEGENRTLCLAVDYIPIVGQESNYIDSISYSGVSLNEIVTTELFGIDEIGSSIWLLSSPISGNNTLDVNFNEPINASVTSLMLNGVQQISPVFQSGTGIGKDLETFGVKTFKNSNGLTFMNIGTCPEDNYITDFEPDQNNITDITASGLNIHSQIITASGETASNVNFPNEISGTANYAVSIIGLNEA